jgi:hypothetical protein
MAVFLNHDLSDKIIKGKMIFSFYFLCLFVANFFEPRLEAKRKDNFYLEIGEAGS